MIKSLYSGVSGLQSHQVAMDVEANNIANVNTVGYKYSRANFSDLLAQVSQVATAPIGDSGGKNATQVGLGVTVSSMTRIFSQGSVQNTDKNTDLAIQGDGFFVVSSDGGKSSKYTRDGDFKFDAEGNFVDNNGFIVQGWLRDANTLEVDSTGPSVPIKIPSGLTTPALATATVDLKANLNAGSPIQAFEHAYNIDTNGVSRDDNGTVIPTSENMNVMFTSTGASLTLIQGNGVWLSSYSATTSSIIQTASATSQRLDINLNGTVIAGNTTAGNSASQNAIEMQNMINAKTADTGIYADLDPSGAGLILVNTNQTAGDSTKNIILTKGINDTTSFVDTEVITAYKYTYNDDVAETTAGIAKKFHTINDLREAVQNQLKADVTARNDAAAAAAVASGNPQTQFWNADDYEVSVDYSGRIKVTNTNLSGEASQMLYTSSEIDGAGANTLFTQNMSAMTGAVTKSTPLTSQSFNAAVHGASIDVYDSLGSKHILEMSFRKTILDLTTGSEWSMNLSVPEPGVLSAVAPFNQMTGTVSFNNNGSFAGHDPEFITFSANNGSSPDQQIDLKMGTINMYDGLTSFSSPSTTSGISQDGYTGGDLDGIRVDQTGTLIGSFSNGRSFGLAQVAMAKFANNEGLVTDGGNVYLQSANSGDPIRGTAATGGRGFIQSSALEASNTDLSRSLTQLIIIQKGYQANSKTVSTSDQLLETLIGLKR
ncbi:MAG: flagellar hook protein FlgE [Helicobacteraceae bacterium]|nr:flagellar hook protein FlgE [Helicobacteraceae bacterium]